uniref:Pitrilysin metalloproteinase 1 n=2 Tax=Myotis lucifugus TaxID=59463 RepID=G1NWE6_MYOLU
MWRCSRRVPLALRLSRCSAHPRAWRWNSTKACERALQYQVGEKIHGFTVSQVTSVPELFLTAVKLSHDGTGARYLHLAREDTNNLFRDEGSVCEFFSFLYCIKSIVLCKILKYKHIKPQVRMTAFPLDIHGNAHTPRGQREPRTSFPQPPLCGSSLRVYCRVDAPSLPRAQSLGMWLTCCVVIMCVLCYIYVYFFNLKTDNERIFSQHLLNRLLPDHTYAVISGGDPLCIPDLTWEQLKQFHATHYHPSNARFFTYGNFPLEQHLEQIHEEALSKFQKIEPRTTVPPQKPWDKPREFQITCAPDSMAASSSKQTTVSVSFLLPEITDTFEAFTLNLLSSLLIGGPNSPFYKALIESGLGTDFSPDVGYNGYTREAYFSVGLQGIAEKDVQTVRDIIDRTIDDVIMKGFEDDRIEALLHKIEIQMKHQSVSFGLALTSYIASCWNHDGDPVELLKLGSQVAQFRQCLKDNPKFLQEKVKQYFKNNQHKLTLSMKPDDKYSEKQAQMETEKLQQKVSALSKEDKQQIYDKGLELQTQQSKAQDASCLPALKVSDIEPRIPFTELAVSLAAGDVPVQYCAQPTNGVVYFRAFSSLNTLPEELRPYVPLFCSVLTKLGCGVLDYREQAQQIELKTGGMTASPHVLPDDSHLDTYEQGVFFSSFCLERNLPDMMHLWSEIFNSPCFEEEEHFKVLVKMTAQELSNGVPDSGHLYASIRASRTLTPAGDLQETFNGMDQVRLMKRIAEMTDISPILRKLPRIKKHLLNCNNMRCAVNATPQQLSQTERAVGDFLRSVGRSKKERKPVRPHVVEKAVPNGCGGSAHVSGCQVVRKLITEPTFTPCQMKTHFLLPFPVNYVGECVRTAPYTHPDHASLKILARLMTAKFLHTEIREKGGAYGGGAKLSHNGIFTFYSYRDPRSTETLQSFAKAVDWAKSGKFSQQDIDEAKLSVFSAVDAPVAPSDKGLDHFLYGLSDELKQAHREQLFAVHREGLIDVSNKYLGVGRSTHGLALLGPENTKIAKDPSWIIR